MAVKRKKRNRNKTMENNKDDQKDREHTVEEQTVEEKASPQQDTTEKEPELKEPVGAETQAGPEVSSAQGGESKDPVQPQEPQLLEIDSLKNKSEQLGRESAAYKDKWLRAEADMDNYKKRVHKEKLEQLKYGYETLIRELLPVIDNLERAIEYSKKHSQKDSLYEGVELTLKLLKKVIEGYGVSAVHTVGEVFDPNFHEGLGVEEGEDYADNVIIREVEKGYIYNDRLLRPAKVIVGKKIVPENIAEEQKN